MFKKKENYEEKFKQIIKESFDEKLNCTKCEKPKLDQKQCEKCFSKFCEQCTIDSLSQYPFCPQCKTLPLILKKLNPIEQASYELILLKCPNVDCDKIITISTFDHHQKICQHLEIPCTNLNCEKKVKRRDLEDHLIQCSRKNKTSKCLRCSQSFEKNERHDCLVNYQQLLKQFTDEKTNMQKLVISTQNILSTMLFTSQIIKSKINESNYIKKNEKLCSNKHNLQWVRSIYGRECFKCKDSDNIVRYICSKCEEFYCQSCLKPTFNDNICPANHKMNFNQKASPDLTCDFCRKSPYQKQIGVYTDRQCNFDICNDCFIALSYHS